MKLRVMLVAVLLMATSMVAQTFRGTILGTVSDPSGAVISGATVKVKNVDTGLERSTQTGSDGSYSLTELPVGAYTVSITQSGFQTSVTNNVRVDAATERRVDASLKPGQVSEQVQVSGEELPMVETTDTTLGGVLTQDTVKDLPINGRDYTKLIFLNPGVSGSPDQITDSPGSFGEFSMNGSRGRSNNYLLDGTDMNDGYRNDPAINQAGVFGTPSAILPIDAISDMHVLSNFQPEYGRNGGAIVNIVTRSGTNRFHGDLFEYFRNDALDARNYFDPTTSPKSPFHNNQFGGSLGGPIIKDKTFFYVDYEGQRENVGVVSLGCVPTLSQIAAAKANVLSSGGSISPIGTAILNFYPHNAANYIPNTVSNDSGCFNSALTQFQPDYTAIAPSFNNLSSFITKIDHSFNQSNNISGRYFFGDSTQQFPLALNASGGQLPGFDTVTPTRVQLVSVSLVTVVSPTKVNELRYGWNRFAEGFFPQDASFNPGSIGFCNVPTTFSSCNSSGMPIVLLVPNATGGAGLFSQIGATSGDPRQRVDTNNQLLDSFSWKVNKHDIKFGGDFVRTSIEQSFDKYSRGRLRFLSLEDMIEMAPQTSSVDGVFDYTGDTRRHTYQNGFGFYVQDSYRVQPRVTLNYGLRWDYFAVVAEKNNLFSDFNPANGTLVPVGPGGYSGLYKPDYRNFSPRVSLAWDVTGKGKTVIRTGYGLFFDQFSQDMMLGHLPYPTFFAPGPAYNNIGPDPVQMANANPAAFNANGQYISGVPIYGTPGCTVECDTFSFDRNIRTPYIENYNLNIQQQLTSKMVLQIGYVGSQGHHLFRFFDLNQPSQATITACDLGTLPGCSFGINDFGVPRPYGMPFNTAAGSTYVFQENSTGISNYNSLQTSLRINNWHGFMSIVNYVWSRSLDNSSDGEDFVVNAAQPQDSHTPQAEYGPSNFNVPNRFTWVAGYNFPTMGGDWKRLKNGWGVDSTVTLQSGQPFTLNYNFEDDYSGGGDGFDRPDVVGPIVYDKGNPSNYLQLSSFAMPCTIAAGITEANLSGFAGDCTPGTRHYGNLGRNALVGPTYKQWDFSLYKDTPITERVNVQLRADFFNLLNHPNFANPVLPAFIADPASNIALGCGCGFHVNGNREVGNGGYQITATGDVGIGNPFLGGGGPRGIQLAAKFTF
ncbi:MAG TPA: carboxypeptidase regulatory-like domain-containing protein [Terriglobales bacterium]|nr:carboxypeptidase regulatory-like domain-containing protein [Terriglobales bacterium]